MTVGILRREFLLGLGAVAVLASEQSSAIVRGTFPAGAPDLSLPLNNLTNLIRMQSSLDAVDQTPWHYNGTLYYQKGSEQPIPVVSIEGMESYRILPQEDGSMEKFANCLLFSGTFKLGKWFGNTKIQLLGKLNK